MFLERKDLIALTGSVRPSTVTQWLERNGIRYLSGIDGWPRVLQSVIEAKMGGSPTSTAKEPRLRLG